MNKTVRRLLPLVAAAVLILAGCGSPPAETGPDSETGDVPSQGFTIAYGSLIDANPIFRAIGTNLGNRADAVGAKVLMFDNDFDPAKALANTRLMIQQQPDVIIQWSPEAANEAVGKLIADAGIPCIALNIAIPGCPLFNLSNALTGDEAGAVAAAEALNRGWTADDTTVALISVSAGGEEGHQGITHFYSSFADNFPGMTPAAPEEITFSTTNIGGVHGVQVDSDGSLDGAYAAMQRILQIVPGERNLVIQTNNNDIARGALRAVEQEGRLDKTLVASSGADEGAIEALRTDPAWIAEGDLSTGQWADYLFAMSRAILDGVELPDLTPTPQILLTKENIDKFYDGTTSRNNAPMPVGAEYLIEFMPEPTS